MNILFLCHRIPYPPNKGDKIRSFNELIYLSREHNIFLGTILDDRNDKGYADVLKKYCKEVYTVCFSKKLKLLKGLFTGKPFSVSNFYDKRLQNYVDNILRHKKIDVVICFCSSMAEYIFQNPLYKMNGLAGIKLVMDFVDMDSDKWLQYARYSRKPLSSIYRLENKRLFKYETQIYDIFDNSIFVSEREVRAFKRLHPIARGIKVIPNGVNYEYFTPKKVAEQTEPEKISDAPVLLFTGIMDYFANEDGVKWFCKSILPRIRARFPGVKFYIVGSKPTRPVRNLAHLKGVNVTGYVDDIRKYYMMADVCVIPLRIARGLQNKVLEAMATGNAVVATSNAKEGIIADNQVDIIIADDAESFAREVINLLNDRKRRLEIGKNAVNNVRINYTWERNLTGFDEILDFQNENEKSSPPLMSAALDNR
jgi:polysaccharide biosynthesis protein PslH